MGIGFGVLMAAVVGWVLRRQFRTEPAAPVDFSRLPVPGSDDVELTCLWCYKVAAVVSRSLIYTDKWEPIRCRHCGVTLTSPAQDSTGQWRVS